jgi:hypothetical protein
MDVEIKRDARTLLGALFGIEERTIKHELATPGVVKGASGIAARKAIAYWRSQAAQGHGVESLRHRLGLEDAEGVTAWERKLCAETGITVAAYVAARSSQRGVGP